MKLYDTALRKYIPFKPGKQVSIYVCGITPYDSAHLGHVFTFMTYDLLQRRLEDLGHSVRMVRNITDVDEPIYERAQEMGISYTELAKQQIDSFHRTMDRLAFRPLYAEPLASDYIEDMALAVQELLKSGFAYYVDEDIYFDVSKYPKFRDFSGFGDRLLLGLADLRGGDPDRPSKHQPLDFLLWKAITDDDDSAQWPTLIGNGRPGWHIECSIMSSTLLGTPFDIHGGGSDLIFPHHSAEIAQSFGLGDSLLARHWAHVYPMLSDGEKMSKSLGNLVFAEDLLKDHPPAVIRLALMHYHHRIGGEWQTELLEEAKQLLHKVHEAKKHTNRKSAEILIKSVRTAIDDDINTLEVIDALHVFTASTTNRSSSDPKGTELVGQVLDLLGLNC